MKGSSRREFLQDVGRGMLISTIGSALAVDLGLAPALADDEPARLSFGELEPLVAFLQETPLEKLQRQLVGKIQSGTELRKLVAAAALANARTFGGEHYEGFHTMMALSPAWQMASRMSSDRQALPILKVLYRNTDYIQRVGGRSAEKLQVVEPASLPQGARPGPWLRDATRSADYTQAERAFAALADASPRKLYNHVQYTVQEQEDVHRVVLAWRSWSTLDLTGREHAYTLLRQSVRYAVRNEQMRNERDRPEPEIRSVLPKLLDQYKLLGRSPGNRQADDEWIASMARLMMSASREEAADAAAAALAEGIDPEQVGEAISLGANLLLLHDPGRRQQYSDEKPIGSVHGDSVGVHASDAANAWRNIARVSNHRNTVASLIAGAYHTAGQMGNVEADQWPLPEHLEQLRGQSPAELLAEAEDAIRAKEQGHACAAVHRYGQLGGDVEAVFDLLLGYATSEDGALHAEKYFQTVTEEFATTRPGFRWRQPVALARVTASEYGKPAPGYEEACQLLKVT